MKEKERLSRLRFNFGHLLDGDLGGFRDVELDYPTIEVGADVTLAKLQGTFRATRTSKGIYLEGTLESVTETECTRCLKAIMLPLELGLDDLFYYPPYKAPVGEYIIRDDRILDLAPLIRELSLLSIPMQVLCRDGCKGICGQCGQNLNEGECDCVVDDIDPRLAKLKTLLEDE
jgi:uncharacterized protein